MSAREAHANGRFPGAYQLVIRDDKAVVLTSYGLISANDAFTATKWLCEAGLGYDPAQNNELGVAVFGGGRVVVSGPKGLSSSADQGCSNPAVGGAAGTAWMVDVSVDENTPSTGIAVARGGRDGDCKGALYETQDEGASWSPLGAPLPDGFCPLTLDSSPSDRSRIYVSGNSIGPDGSQLVGQLVVSEDRGQTWTSRPILDEALPFIGAMDPLDANTLYVRSLLPPASGNLLVTRDAGRTFQVIAKLSGAPLQFFGVTGIAVSPDGKKVAYGSIDDGLFVLENGTSEKRNSLPVMCLAWHGNSLYACSAPNRCGPFFVGKSSDDGRSFDTLLPSLDIGGDRTTCAANTPIATTCPPLWASFIPRFRSCDGGVPAADAAPPGTDAGATAPPAPPPLGCACNMALADERPLALCAIGALALLFRGLRRRR